MTRLMIALGIASVGQAFQARSAMRVWRPAVFSPIPAMTDLVDYLELKQNVVAPKKLAHLCEILGILGMEVFDFSPEPPRMPSHVHPLVVPLASDASGVIGVLRWPRAKLSTELPVVRCEPSSGQVTLLAKSCADYAARLAAEADFREHCQAPTILGLANLQVPYEKQIEAGSVKNFNRGIDRYLLLKVAPFPDTYRNLAQGHLERGDRSSALITVCIQGTPAS